MVSLVSTMPGAMTRARSLTPEAVVTNTPSPTAADAAAFPVTERSTLLCVHTISTVRPLSTAMGGITSGRRSSAPCSRPR